MAIIGFKNIIMHYSFKLSALILAFILWFPSTGTSQISNPDTELNTIESGMILAQTLEGSHFNEFWNYQFYFNNGMKVHITFSAANFGSLKDPVTGVRISVFNHDDELYQVSREYPLSRLVQDEEKSLFKLRDDRDVYFEGKLPERHRVVVKTSKDGVEYDIDLQLNNIQKGFKLGNGMYQIGGEQVGIVTHIPYAEASGHVTINGNRERVNGTAYMDHTWQNQTTTRLMHSGYRVIVHNSSNNWDLLYVMLPNESSNNETIGHRVYNSDGKLHTASVENIEVVASQSAFGSKIPRIIDMKLSDESAIRISRSEDDERFAVLGELSWIARRAARTFLGGEVIDYRGEATLMETGIRPKHGEYNFFFVD
ncbi:lipocalin-like domain-containing protein [Rhodohalobacter sp.]|uniref:lipocalin-like domain-containing protein n=1 Tax=Rhodohalobacter sp. TaxID=1974210 RepID=UPI002ACE49C8|nr:lipocalin-like domain-containing protein [Rhodohalobacter sp.]MDZ7757040.1 lipocalin-like domain-containing protein [Rhodohalobacter sp.]